MTLRSKAVRVCLCLSVIILNAIILFVVIPEASSRFPLLYGAHQYSDGYDMIAGNLAAGNGYRFYPYTAKTLMREPGYPIFLAGIFMLFRKSFAAVELANLLLALGAAWLLTCIASEVSSSKIVILGSALLFLFHPGTLIAESRGAAEVLFTFALTLFIFVLYAALRSNRLGSYLLSGAVLGLTCLIRSTPILFPVLLLGYLLVFAGQGIRKAIIFRNVAVMVIAMWLVLSPWVVRNYLLTGKFVPTASVLGVAAQSGLYHATHQSAWGRRIVDREGGLERDELARALGYRFEGSYYQYFYSSADEVAFSNYLFKRVVGEYERSPMLFIRVLGANLLDFWWGGKTSKSSALDAAVQIPFLLLAIAGFVLAARNGQLRLVAPLSLLIMYVEAVSLPILGQARYSVPLIPFVSILGCVALAAARTRLSGGKKVRGERVVPPWRRFLPTVTAHKLPGS